MKSVLEIMGYASAYAGNFIASVLSLSRALRDRDVQTVFVFPPEAQKRDWVQTLRAEKIPVYFLPRGTLRTAVFLRRLCRRYGVFCVHTHFIDHSAYVPLRLACLFNRIPHVFHAHSLPKFSEHGPRLCLRRALMHPARVLCVSDAVRLAYTQRGFEHCVTIPNGVDFSRLDAGDAIQLTHPTVMMFGYDIRIKGVDTALDAFVENGLHRRYRLAICTAGRAAEVENYLRARFGAIPEWVTLLPPRQDVGAYFRAADVFLSASRTEGMPYAVLEAAYCGRPIVLSDIPAHRTPALPETVFFAPEDGKALSDAVEQAAAEAPSARNREYVCSHFTLDAWTRAVCAQLMRQTDYRKGKEGTDDEQ